MIEIILVVITIASLIAIVYKIMGNKNSTNRSLDNNNSNLNNNEEIDYSNINNNNLINNNNNFDINNINQVNDNYEIDPNKKYTKKELHKMEKKKAKAEEREYRENLIKLKKEKKLQEEKAYQLREEKKKEEEEREQELINKLKEEKERKEAEEYKIWEKTFNVEEEGIEKTIFDDKKTEEFIYYIKLRKVVSLEDLGGYFKLTSNEVVDKLTDLEMVGKITGIIDDRGKYIYLTDKEILSIEKLIINRGRISKQDMIAQCNKIIRFEPTEEDKVLIMNQNQNLINSVVESNS